MLRVEATRTLPDTLGLQLLGCWDLRSGTGLVSLGVREQRLVALLALRGRRPRTQIAGTLWPDTTDVRALSSLRAAVLRVRRSAPDLIDGGRTSLALAAEVQVDVNEVMQCVADVAADPADDPARQVSLLRHADLLPGWYEDWVVVERERLQHLRLLSLESVARAALDRGDFDLALTAAIETIAIEPLRESAHAIAIRAHLMAGNQSSAVTEYRDYRHLLRSMLAIAPSRELNELLTPLLVPIPRRHQH